MGSRAAADDGWLYASGCTSWPDNHASRHTIMRRDHSAVLQVAGPGRLRIREPRIKPQMAAYRVALARDGLLAGLREDVAPPLCTYANLQIPPGIARYSTGQNEAWPSTATLAR